MLYATAGARLYICNVEGDQAASLDVGPLPVAGWVEIAETEALGLLGFQWEMDQADIGGLGATEEESVIVQVKRSRRQQPMQIVMGIDFDDLGQSLLWKAARSLSHYPFRLVLSSGETRGWWGQVTDIADVFDAANSVMKLQASILPHHSGIIRSEDA